MIPRQYVPIAGLSVSDVEAAGSAAKAATAASAVANIALGASMSMMWTMLASLQIISYMSYFNGEMPENVRASNSAVSSFADLDLLPTDEILESFGFAEANDEKEGRLLQAAIGSKDGKF